VLLKGVDRDDAVRNGAYLVQRLPT
jgi:hypothetical protein